MAIIIKDKNKLDELKKINKTIIHDNQLDTFDNQLLALASGKLDNNYPMIIDSESNVLNYIDGVTSDSVLVMNISTAAKIQSKHPESYLFLSRLHSLLENSIFAMDSLTEETSKVILLDEMLDNNPLIAICRYDKKHSASNPQIYVNEITSVYDKDNFISLIQRTWDNNKIFSKNKKIEEYLIKSTWLQLPTDLMFALSNSYDSESFNKSQVEYDLEVKRIDDFIIKLISDKDGVCNGYISSNIVSSNDLINSLVNIRRMDNPLDFVVPYLSGVFEDDKLGDIVNNNLLGWDYEPIFDSDLSACLKAIQDGVIDGCYDFSFDYDGDISNSLSNIISILADDGVIANTQHNNNILHMLGFSDDVLNYYSVDLSDLNRLKNNDNDVAAVVNTNNNYSNYQNIFNNYSNDKTTDLEKSEDAFGQSYPTLMICSINNLPNCSIVYVPNKLDCLCYIDEDKQLHIDNNTVPDVLATQMTFDKIDRTYLQVLNEYWSGLNLDEVMDIFNNRSMVNDKIENRKEI